MVMASDWVLVEKSHHLNLDGEKKIIVLFGQTKRGDLIMCTFSEDLEKTLLSGVEKREKTTQGCNKVTERKQRLLLRSYKVKSNFLSKSRHLILAALRICYSKVPLYTVSTFILFKNMQNKMKLKISSLATFSNLKAKLKNQPNYSLKNCWELNKKLLKFFHGTFFACSACCNFKSTRKKDKVLTKLLGFKSFSF